MEKKCDKFSVLAQICVASVLHVIKLNGKNIELQTPVVGILWASEDIDTENHQPIDWVDWSAYL